MAVGCRTLFGFKRVRVYIQPNPSLKKQLQLDPLRPFTSHDSPAAQFTLGGKKTFQKIGAAVKNSIGTSDPSPVTCGARTTLASTLFPVFKLSSVNFVPSGSGSDKMI